MSKESTSEVWRPITGYEGFYEVSIFGRVKSLSRTVLRATGFLHSIPEKILKPRIVTHGKYYAVSLCKNHIARNFMIHKLVAQEFLAHRPDRKMAVVNHIDNDSHNNRLENLEVVTSRQNSSCHKHLIKTKTSRFVGVSKSKQGWRVDIRYNGVQHYLGEFSTEEVAKQVYDNKLKELQCGLKK